MRDKRSVDVILLRGLAREAKHWGDFPEMLKRRLEAEHDSAVSAHVHAIDLPGAGRYSEMQAPVSIAAIAEFTRAQWLKIKSNRAINSESLGSSDHSNNVETHLIAVSLGGIVASSWLDRWPEDFASTILVNTSFRGFSPWFERLRPEAMRWMAQILKEQDDERRERLILEMTSNRPEIFERVSQEWAALHRLRPISLGNFARQLAAAITYKPSLESPLTPVLVVGSKLDRMVHPRCSETIASRWGCQLIQHATAGHDLPLDDGPWLVDRAAGWILGGKV